MQTQNLYDNSYQNLKSQSLLNYSQKNIIQDIGKKITIKITKQLQDQIYFLCSKISQVEWSGVLLFSFEKNDFDSNEIVILAKEVFLQDIGSQAYTEYQFDSDFTNFIMSRPDLMDCLYGHIHSHAQMSVFFSSTDNDELYDNSEIYNYYLSLIVNNRNEMCARVAYREIIKTKGISKIKIRNNDGEWVFKNDKEVEEEKVVVRYYDCNIEKENLKIEVADYFIKRYDVIKDKKVKSSVNYHQNYYHNRVVRNEPTHFSTELKDVVKNTPNRDEIINFLIVWLNSDSLSNKPLNSTIATINFELKSNQENKENLIAYLTDTLDTFYLNSFPEDDDFIDYDNTIDRAIIILTGYNSMYPDTIKELNKILLDSKVPQRELSEEDI